MRYFAAIPALLVLVSLCGSPVPPPPGTVTGTVFFDANRNGIRDSCDSPMKNTQVIVTGPDGATGTSSTNEKGEFKVEDAPVGGGTVTLFTDAAHVWPITTAPQAVRVQGSKETSGVVIGSASRSVYDANVMSISGVIFDDRNANGEIDKDECGISGAGVGVRSPSRLAVVSSEGRFDMRNLPADHEAGVIFEYGLFGGAYVSESLRPRRPTNGVPGDEPCTSIHEAAPRYGPLTLEANIGVGDILPNSSLTGIVFDDRDRDGSRDAGESGVEGALVRMFGMASCVASDDQSAGATDADGRFRIPALYSGEYKVYIDPNMINGSDFVVLSIVSPRVTLGFDEEATLDLPATVGPGGSVRVTVFDDDDGDGVEDSGEGWTGVSEICAYRLDPEGGYYGPGYGPGSCTPTDGYGKAEISPLAEGVYSVSFSGGMLGLVRYPDPITINVHSGEETPVAMPIAYLSVEEQMIPPGEGEVLELEVCHSDAAWTQPAFDVAYEQPEVTIPEGPTREQAQLIYEHGIYAYNSYDMGIWSSIAGRPLGPDKAPPSCGFDFQMLYLLVGYEPLEVLGGEYVTQVKLAHRDAGLFVLDLPIPASTSLSGPPIAIFVDQRYAPIVRCAGYGGCDWVDGTVPYYQHGWIMP